MAKLDTIKSKLSNFFYYYKWYVLLGAVLLFILGISIEAWVTRVEPDVTVVLYTYDLVSTDQSQLMESYLTQLAQDINGDGQVKVTVKNLSIAGDDADLYDLYRKEQQMQMELMSNNQALLYMVDSRSEATFTGDAYAGVFSAPVPLSETFYAATASDRYGTLEGLYLKCRLVEGTMLEQVEGIDTVAQEAQRVMEQITQ